jgi:hypothetical protein
MPYFVVEREYVGYNANEDKYLNTHCAWVQTNAPWTNRSNEVLYQGWLGTTNDWCWRAHGKFPTLEQAKEALQHLFPQWRYAMDEECRFDLVLTLSMELVDGDHNIVFCGKYPTMHRSGTEDMLQKVLRDKVKPDSSDLELELLVDLVRVELEAELACTINMDIAMHFARGMRDE